MKKIIVLVYSIVGIYFFCFAETPVIVIDPLHGGKDTGGYYINNKTKKTVYEKDIVLALAKKIEAELKERYPQIQTIMTRSDDSDMTFSDREEKIQATTQNHQTICLRLHINSSTDTSSTGFKLLIPEPASTLGMSLAQYLTKSLDQTIGSYMQNKGIGLLQATNLSNSNKVHIFIGIGCLSNQKDMNLLLDNTFLVQCSEGIVTGIKNYIDSLS